MDKHIEVQGLGDNIVRATKNERDNMFLVTTLDPTNPSDYVTTAMSREQFEELISELVDLL